jgi:hypothetical protein
MWIQGILRLANRHASVFLPRTKIISRSTDFLLVVVAPTHVARFAPMMNVILYMCVYCLCVVCSADGLLCVKFFGGDWRIIGVLTLLLLLLV